MNKNVTKIIVLLIALAVISVAAFLTTKQSRKKIEANKPRTQLFELNETNVTKYELKYAEEPIIVEKIDETWKVIAPSNDYKIDQLEAFANVKNFNTLNIDSTITNLAELDSFGLENPSNEFTVWEGDKEYKVFVGNKTADEEKYYVKYNDEYFSVELIYIEALKKTIDMLRDKQIFDKTIYIDSVVKTESNIRDYTNTIRKENRTNWVVDGVDEEISLDKAYRDFEALSLVKATGFVYDENMIKYLNRLFRIPDAVITIYMEDNTKTQYEIVYDNNDNRVYVKPQSGIIYEVDYNIYSAAMRDRSYYIKTEDDEKETNNENDPYMDMTEDGMRLDENLQQ
ncbi:DUF4340 domain-containing protein [Brachyspira hyodysenteriae]|uniref:DUF4340 domain-containing protein n=1 Tax=Brachyspira hyodysenteriae (strain ATCC 49526 / WA1) TaxID=565034 RepID=A0A3B6VGT8_BRAHW|nr:DUF4340 domain-containing protein [Brachyspira hyodysenteriae]ACN85111.1 hypothetical protein BHWA1_02660 [Brachyspira hyodysenteriae WA1]AUJ50827.1 hypothetical protein BH718_02399 [Brachyspira hyodysenteriae]KLI19742.1 hypothetical protein SU46_06560 [Brachyspira hyodysenteriae]KLI21536.1 hypothetical protein SU43_09755 [Brachyspira hyodysenteriae]KLI37238.1 hypothetical protein SZ51_10320 [Brachyspira hyodysenteriae]